MAGLDSALYHHRRSAGKCRSLSSPLVNVWLGSPYLVVSQLSAWGSPPLSRDPRRRPPASSQSVALWAEMRNSRLSVLLGCVLLCSASLLYLGMSGIECPPKSHRHRWMELNLGSANQNLSLNEHFPEDTPLIFIGGFPRSGTTLMRVMLDAHKHVRCGEETRVIPRLLTMRATWSRSAKERVRLDEAGVTDQVLDSAVRAFLLEVSWSHDGSNTPWLLLAWLKPFLCALQVIVGHGEPAPRLCNKDPFALKSLSYLSHIFPKAKFVLMLRDGRATVHSMISRKVGGVSFRQQLHVRHRASPLAHLVPLRPCTGHHLWLWPDQLQRLSDQVEQRRGDHVRAVPGRRGGQMSARPLRTAGAPHGRGNEEAAALPGAAVGSGSAAPRGADWKGWRRFTLQVSVHTCLPARAVISN